MKVIVILLCIVLIFSFGWSQTEKVNIPDRFKVLKGTPEEEKAGAMFLNYVEKVIFKQIDKRNEVISSLKTKEEWKSHIKYVEKTFKEIIGTFPERTPLNAKVVGILDRKDYRIEKIIYESLPQFYVTCNLYIPKNVSFPVPAVLNVLGHTSLGKTEEERQIRFINLARRGYIVFAIDPISQGERLQYLDRKTGEDLVAGSPTAEHNMAGNQCHLLGINLALYRTWDGMRALDYLCSRPEVDKERIACTGSSGGGTMTSYLSGLDQRISVSIPVDYVTTWRSRIDAKLSTDAEQLFPGSIAKGVDNRSDFTFLIAPRPLLMGVGIKDNLNPYPGVKVFAPVIEHLYEIFGHKDKFKLESVDVAHTYSKQHRQALYIWLNRWFNYGSGDIEEIPCKIEEEKTLWCTKTGQVLTSLGGKSVAELNKEYAQKIIPKFKELKSINDFNREKKKIVDAVKGLIGYKSLTSIIKSRTIDSFQWGDFRGEKILFYPESDIFVPGLLIFPTNVNPPYPTVVYVDERAKLPDSGARQIIRAILDNGIAVFIIDPRGMGETSTQQSGSPVLYSIMTDQPAFGMQVRDVVGALLYLLNRNDIDKKRITCMGKGLGGLLTLYSAAVEPQFAGVSTVEQLYTYKSLVENGIYKYGLEIIIPGVLKYYDIPNLAGTIAPRPLLIINPIDHNKEIISGDILNKDYEWSYQAYSAVGSRQNIRMLNNFEGAEAREIFTKWLRSWAE